MAIGDNVQIFDGFGCTRFPVNPDLVGDDVTAANLDSGQDTIIALLAAAINADVGAAWQRIVQNLPNNHFLMRENLSASQPVNFTTDSEPNPALTTQQLFDWPVLAVWPSGQPEEFELTMAIPALRQNWSIAYLIGPLDAAWQRKLGRGICRLVFRSIQRTIWKGYHPAYMNGQRQFFGQFSEISTKGCEGPGVTEILDKEKNIGYYGLGVTLQTVERTVQDDFDEVEEPANYGYVPAGTASLTQQWSATENDLSFDNQTAPIVGILP
jgi:hypothetical protein